MGHTILNLSREVTHLAESSLFHGAAAAMRRVEASRGRSSVEPSPRSQNSTTLGCGLLEGTEMFNRKRHYREVRAVESDKPR